MSRVSRQALIAVAGNLLLAACGPDGNPSGNGAAGGTPPPTVAEPVVRLVNPDGTYPVVPLEKDTVVVKVVQNGFTNLQEAPSMDDALQDNLNRMIIWARKACSEGKKPDFILYNEFPLTGYSSGTREEKLKFTIQVPGPETDALGEVAKECDTYIVFGSYARDPEWPGHIISINAVIGRDGTVVKQFWKTRSIKRLNADTEIPTTTVENVRDKYRARYGIEEEFPVLRTEFGNIAVSTVQLDPFVFAAFAMRGVEIMLRTATLFSKTDVMATAYFNNFYSAMSNIIFPEDSPYLNMGGGSLIVGPRGKVLAEDPSPYEGVIEAEIPIAEFRRNRRIPRYPLDVVKPVFDQYQQEVPLNHLDMPSDELPSTGEDMKALLDAKSRWLQ
jgi:predicted amidohydrolase